MDKQNAEEAFVFYRSFFEAMEGLGDADKLALFDAIARMGLYGEQPKLPLEAKRLFVLIVPQLVANRKKRAEGRKGGRYSKTNGYSEIETSGYSEKETSGSENEEPKEKEKEKENETEKEKEKDIYMGPEAPAPKAHIYIQPPSLEEIRSYCQERGNQVDPEYFYHYYQSNGWRVGKNPMRDWKAAVCAWETNGMAQKMAPAKEPSVGDNFKKAMEILRMKEAKQV